MSEDNLVAYRNSLLSCSTLTGIDGGSSPSAIICENCGKSFESIEVKRFCSSSCRHSFIAKQNSNHKNNLPLTVGKGSWKCPECDKTFETKNKLYEHRHKVHNLKGRKRNQSYNCKYCGCNLGIGPYRILWKNHRAECKEFLKNHTSKGAKIWNDEEKAYLSEKQRNNTYRRLMRKTQEYHGVLYDSSWEIEMAKRLEFLNEQFERPKNPIKYIGVDGKQHNYFPDFWIPRIQKFIEVKNPYLFENDSKVQILKSERSDIIWLTSLEQIQNFGAVAQLD